MRYKIEFTEQAEIEADKAYEWISRESPASAISDGFCMESIDFIHDESVFVLHIRHGAQQYLPTNEV